MEALLKLRAFLGGGLLAAAGCAQAALPESSPEQVVAAVRDCAEATGPGGLDEPTLLARGYERASTSQDGKEIDIDFIILGKPGGPLILSGPSGTRASAGCLIVGGNGGRVDFDHLLTALADDFEPAGSVSGDHYFRAGHNVVVAAARTGDGTTFRVAVLESGVKQ